MFVADLGMADAAGGESLDALLAVLAVVHVDRAVEDDEDLRTVVDVPDVGLVGPVQPDGRLVDLRDVERPPRSICREVACFEESHSSLLSHDVDEAGWCPGR